MVRARQKAVIASIFTPLAIYIKADATPTARRANNFTLLISLDSITETACSQQRRQKTVISDIEPSGNAPHNGQETQHTQAPRARTSG